LQKEKPQSTNLQACNNRELVVFLKSPYLQQECTENSDKNNQEAESLNTFCRDERTLEGEGIKGELKSNGETQNISGDYWFPKSRSLTLQAAFTFALCQ
jgi:hypothetical protein